MKLAKSSVREEELRQKPNLNEEESPGTQRWQGFAGIRTGAALRDEKAT